MKKNFVSNMDINRVRNYSVPQMVLLSGNPGSGKTYIARELSKKNKFFLLSTDYVRNYYFSHPEEVKSNEKIPRKVRTINAKRLLKLLVNRKSFIYDKDVNTKKEFEKYQLISRIFGYELTLIGLESSDDVNIARINNRVMNFDKIVDGVIGDNVYYSTSYPESCYYEIKERKPRGLEYSDFDYIINNDGSLEELNGKIEDINDDFDYKLSAKM